MFIKINNRCYWIHADAFNKSSKIHYLHLYFVYDKLCWTYFVRIFLEVSILTNNIELKADSNYLSQYNFQHSTFSPIWVCDTLIKLYICNEKIHTQKSKVLNFFDNLKFDRKADIVMHSRSMRCVWNLPRSCTSIGKSREHMLDSNNKSDKLHEVAQLELYRDSLKHEFLVVF